MLSQVLKSLEVLNAQRRYDASANRSRRKSTTAPNDVRRDLELSGLGKLNFNTKLDLGQYRIEAGIAGGGF